MGYDVIFFIEEPNRGPHPKISSKLQFPIEI